MTDRMTLVERLRNPLWVRREGVDRMLDVEQTLADLTAAANEIERLQRLAGAVTVGESFSQLRGIARSPSTQKG